MTERPTTQRDARGLQYRAVPMTFRADGDPGFSGYASTFWRVDSYATAIAPGAFTKTLNERGDKVKVLWQHLPWEPIGKPTAMEQDDTGLRVDAKITEATQSGREAMALVREGLVDGLSIGFAIYGRRSAEEGDPLIFDDAPEWVRRDPTMVEVITEVKLYEFSVVTFPANEASLIEDARSAHQIDSLSLALADLRAGRLDPACRPLVADLVAAWRDAPDGQPPAPRDAKAPRRIDALATLARYSGVYLKEHAA